MHHITIIPLSCRNARKEATRHNKVLLISLKNNVDYIFKQELALLHHSRRTATVTSQGTVQLLTIGRADFFDIFMSGQGPDDIPDHIKFIR